VLVLDLATFPSPRPVHNSRERAEQFPFSQALGMGNGIRHIEEKGSGREGTGGGLSLIPDGASSPRNCDARLRGSTEKSKIDEFIMENPSVSLFSMASAVC
jgi:hypothetical protein